MSGTAATYVAVFSTAALAIGWFLSRAWIANGDLNTRLRQIPRLREERNHSGGIAVSLAVIVLLVLYVIARHHH